MALPDTIYARSGPVRAHLGLGKRMFYKQIAAGLIQAHYPLWEAAAAGKILFTGSEAGARAYVARHRSARLRQPRAYFRVAEIRALALAKPV